MATPKRVDPNVSARDEEAEGAVTTMDDLTGQSRLPTVEVDPLLTPTVPPPQGIPMVEIRVNEAVEEMSHVAGGRVERYSFEPGVRYRVPFYIAQELENLGKIWH